MRNGIACLVALALSVGIAHAQTGLTIILDRNATFRLEVGTGINAKVSGTNVNYPAAVTVGVNPLHADPYWTSASISNVKLWINGVQLVITGPINGHTYSVRFASTNFPDQSTITLKITATCTLTKAGDPPITKVLEGEAIRTTQAVNIAVQAAAREDTDSSGYNLSGWAEAARQGVNESRPKFQTMNHDRIPATLDSPLNPEPSEEAKDKSVHKLTSQIQAAWDASPEAWESMLLRSTVFFAFVHGSTAAVYSSFLEQSAWSWISGRISARTAGYPPHNLAIVYACSTWGEPARDSFGLLYANQAYVGFDQMVWSNLYNDSGLLWQHTRELMRRLSIGERIGYAVEQTNKAFRPRNQDGQELDMLVTGDTYARLINVYLNSSEWSDPDLANVRNTWYWAREMTIGG